MSQYRHYRRDNYYAKPPRARGKIMGVCAGIAHQFDWDVTLVRIVALLLLLTFSGMTLIAYIIAGALFY